MQFPQSVTDKLSDGRIDKVNYRVASLLKIFIDDHWFVSKCYGQTGKQSNKIALEHVYCGQSKNLFLIVAKKIHFLLIRQTNI